MAGNAIPYFPLNCSLGIEMRFIEARFGIVGYGIILKLWSHIYGGEGGYYCDWNEGIALLFATEEAHVDVATVEEIVDAALQYGIFDRDLYARYGILTSHGIQIRFFEAVKRRSSTKIIDEYLLVDVRQNNPYVSKISEIVCKNQEIACRDEQIREDKRREDKRRADKGGLAALPSSEEVVALYNEICRSLPQAELTNWRHKTITDMRKPLEEYQIIFEKVQKSDYLSGRSGRWTSCSLDWILREQNWQKIKEGTYDRNDHDRRGVLAKASNHHQRAYSEDDLRKIGIDLLNGTEEKT